jgi:hypothetical protein
MPSPLARCSRIERVKIKHSQKLPNLTTDLVRAGRAPVYKDVFLGYQGRLYTLGPNTKDCVLREHRDRPIHRQPPGPSPADSMRNMPREVRFCVLLGG